MTAAPLEARDVSHAYGGARALHDLSLRFEAGRVHALVGRNGAGKSTLLKALSGSLTPSAGSILVDGAPARLRSPHDALAHGIATVHQELTLIGELSVAENILLDGLPRRRTLPFLLDRRAAREEAARALGALGVAIDPAARAASLSFAEQQLVEIARAIRREPRVLLLDEATSALSAGEVDALVAVMRSLAERGVALVHVTHRLDELPRVAREVSVLRDGRLVATIDAKDAQPRRLVELMFGAEEAAKTRATRSRREATPGAAPLLACRDLASGPRLRGASLAVEAGEILGIAGLLGSGRSELLASLFGARPSTGEIRLDGRPVAARTPRAMAALGVALVPEDRKREGLCLELGIADNASLPSLPLIAHRGWLTRRRVRDAVRAPLDALGLVAPEGGPSPPLEARAGALSGGNQQKVVVAKWLLEPRRVLLLDEPTKGVDLAARRQIFDAVRRMAEAGVAIVMVSSELEELHETCDRIVVMRHGRSVAECDPAATPLAALFALAMGDAARASGGAA